MTCFFTGTVEVLVDGGSILTGELFFGYDVDLMILFHSQGTVDVVDHSMGNTGAFESFSSVNIIQTNCVWNNICQSKWHAWLPKITNENL